MSAAALHATPDAGAGGGSLAGYGHPVTPGEVDVSHKVILYLEGVTVSFDGFRALDDLSLAIDDGELRCVIGPNGAGKTTMMDVITGRTRPDAGRVFFGQAIDLTRMSESAIAQAGIGRKFQKPTVFEQHTVWENLELALKGDRRWWRGLSWRTTLEAARRIDDLLATIRLEDEAHRPAGLLAHGQKQRLEIGILLAQQPRLLLLDEPVAGMTDEESERLADLLTTLEGRQSIVVVEHDMEFVKRIAKRVTVLHEGSVLAEGTLDEVKANDAVVEVYLGR
ncbi:MAG TPA: urea ABC transporter ATP-binding protein UrtD [Casimicrobiaceae bacterium]|nr:urea ABC transporter ATP-binding protein UrtD [Casimicrobiaceae bacterium]